MIAVAAFGNFILMISFKRYLKVVTEDCLFSIVIMLLIYFLYYEPLLWWSELRDQVDCDGEHKSVWIFENGVGFGTKLFRLPAGDSREAFAVPRWF